ncbi:MAG: hypothetical protein AB7E34_05050 [Acidaminococcaceae bacterium]
MKVTGHPDRSGGILGKKRGEQMLASFFAFHHRHPNYILGIQLYLCLLFASYHKVIS